LLAQQQNNK